MKHIPRAFQLTGRHMYEKGGLASGYIKIKSKAAPGLRLTMRPTLIDYSLFCKIF